MPKNTSFQQYWQWNQYSVPGNIQIHAVRYLFKKQGLLTFGPEVDEERLIDHALELGVDDVISNEDQSVEVITSPESFMTVKDALAKLGFKPAEADVTMRADVNVAITDQDTAEKVMNLIDVLEDLDDVQTVYSNADIAEEILSEM